MRKAKKLSMRLWERSRVGHRMCTPLEEAKSETVLSLPQAPALVETGTATRSNSHISSQRPRARQRNIHTELE